MSIYQPIEQPNGWAIANTASPKNNKIIMQGGHLSYGIVSWYCRLLNDAYQQGKSDALAQSKE